MSEEISTKIANLAKEYIPPQVINAVVKRYKDIEEETSTIEKLKIARKGIKKAFRNDDAELLKDCMNLIKEVEQEITILEGNQVVTEKSKWKKKIKSIISL